MNVYALEVGIVSGEAEALAAFYYAAFGFSLEARYEFPEGRVLRLRCGNARLKIYQPADGAEVPPRPEPWFRDRGFAFGAIHVTDAVAAVGAAAEHGARVLTSVTGHRPGARFAMIVDPEGNTWEILEEAEDGG